MGTPYQEATAAERAGMRVREELRRLRVREEEMRELTEHYNSHELPIPDSEDVERTVAYLEARDQLEEAIRDFRAALLPQSP
jgi:hypothetical protein